MIGYYIHHHGRGHLARATAIAEALDCPVAGLSSLPRPSDWRGDWVELPLDTSPSPEDPTAGNRLHWAPIGHRGLRDRMSRISQWIGDTGPAALVTDVSVEVGLLARLHGVPVVSVAMPGHRDDSVHALGFEISTAVIAAWPASAEGMITGLPAAAVRKIEHVGAISRFAGRRSEPNGARGRVVVLGGAGGDDFTAQGVQDAREQTGSWEWVHLGASGTWAPDPWEHLLGADVVVTHAGESAIADVSAARRPAVVIPQPRPFQEQWATASALAGSPCPVTVQESFSGTDWARLLEETAEFDGERWATWNDGRGAARAARIIARVAREYGASA